MIVTFFSSNHITTVQVHEANLDSILAYWKWDFRNQEIKSLPVHVLLLSDLEFLSDL